MKVFSNIWSFIKALRFVDIVFFLAVITLLILIVTLLYFIKINNSEKKQDDEVGDETAEMKIVKELKDNMKNSDVRINFTEYEKDQEDKAIISYDELLNKNNNYELNYEKEEVSDDVVVKKVNLDNMVNKSAPIKNDFEVRLISFSHEEAFLEALKRLQKELG